MKKLLAAVALALSHAALAVPESLVVEKWDSDIWPYYQRAAHKGFILGRDDVPLRYVEFPRDDEDAAIIYLPGRGEVHHQYAELVYDLRDKPWSIYILDHRGQGESGRMLSNPRKGHVEDFEWYVQDVKRFFDVVVNARPHRKIILMGHSMGGAVASLFAEEFPDEIDGLVLVTPMHQANYKPYSESIAAMIAFTNVSTGRHELYAINQGDPTEPETFDKQRSTHSEARFSLIIRLNEEFPDLRLGGVTYGWAHESVKGARKARTEAFRVTAPVLLFQAGQDEVVLPTGQDAFCSRARDCNKVELKESKHNPLRETDAIRDEALHQLGMFVDSVVDGSSAQGCSHASPAGPGVLALLFVMWRRARR